MINDSVEESIETTFLNYLLVYSVFGSFFLQTIYYYNYNNPANSPIA